MKHTIGIPSVLPGRRVRWTFEVSAERREIPLSTPPRAGIPVSPAPEAAEAAPISQPAAPPVALNSDAVKPAAAGARRVARSRTIALATAAAAIVAALTLASYFVSGEEPDPAEAFFASEVATPDRGSTEEPIASAPAAPSTPAAATPAQSAPAAPVTPAVRPIAPRPALVETPSTPAPRRVNDVKASAATIVDAPAPDTREPEKATPADVSATEIASAPATPAATAVDEVTITGCLEIDTEQTRFRLANTEGASVPKARSWRSGFFKKRAAPVDLIGVSDALSLEKQVGQRIAATGLLTSRTLKVSSVRTVSPSCD